MPELLNRSAGGSGRKGIVVIAGIVVLLAVVTGYIITRSQAAMPMQFGTLATFPDHVSEESAAGVKHAMMEIFWDRYEPQRGQFNQSYVAEIKAKLVAYKAAGMQVTLALGTYNPPGWVSSIPNAGYVNQDGMISTKINAVYNQKVRDAVARYYARINADLGFSNFSYIRLTSISSGEMLYPDHGYWGFDANAKGEADLPAGMQPNPYPNWRPGSGSLSPTQVGQWADWYVGSLAKLTDWQMKTLDDMGFTGTYQLLTPGSGVRPSRYQDLINRGMPNDDVMQVGAAWYAYYRLLPNRNRTMVYVSSVADRSGNNDTCQVGDTSISPTSNATDNWSATRYLARIASSFGMPLGGENVGYDQPPQINSFYADESESGMMAVALAQAKSCNFDIFYWAHDERFWQYGTLPFSLFAGRIKALGASATTPAATDSATPAATAVSTTSASGFVKRSGTQLTLDGKLFKFVGFGLFDAAASDFYKCGWWDRYTDAQLDAEFKYMREQSGTTVLRVWFYQTYTKGGTDWTGTDKVIRIAKANGIKLIPVFEDGPGYCTTGNAGDAKWKYPGDAYYVTGYKQKYGSAAMSLRDYAPLVAARYKNEPTIMAWGLANEPDTSAKNAKGQSVLVDFVNDLGALVRAADPNHLITYGGQSNGVSGASGQDYIDVNSSPYIDFGEIHNYHYQDSDTEPLPGSNDGKTLPDPRSADCLKQYQGKGMLACSVAQAIKVVGKPVIIGEAGIAASDASSRANRAKLFDAKLGAAFSSGVSGYLVWQWNKVLDSERFDIQSTTNDPLLAVMKKYAGSTVTPQPTGTPSGTVTPSPETPRVPTPAPGTGTPCAVPSSLAGFINDSQFAYTGAWQTSSGCGKLLGDDHYSGANGATATVRFSGTGIKLYGAAAPHHGIAAVSIDGGAETLVDLYSTGRSDAKLLWLSPTLAGGSHTAVIRVTSQRNAASSGNTVALDGAVATGATGGSAAGDLNGDGKVNVLDLSRLLGAWGKTTVGDLNGDGKTDITDLSILLAGWTH